MAENKKDNMDYKLTNDQECMKEEPVDPAGSDAGEMSVEDLGNASGGADRTYISKESCPVFGSKGYQFVFTGESRPTDAWFYKTEEHYKCACGRGYWSAGALLFTEFDEIEK